MQIWLWSVGIWICYECSKNRRVVFNFVLSNFNLNQTFINKKIVIIISDSGESLKEIREQILRFCRHMDDVTLIYPPFWTCGNGDTAWSQSHWESPTSWWGWWWNWLVKPPLAKTSQWSTSSCQRKKHISWQVGKSRVAVAYSLHRTHQIVYQRSQLLSEW